MFKIFLKLCIDNLTLGEKVQLIQLLEQKDTVLSNLHILRCENGREKSYGHF